MVADPVPSSSPSEDVDHLRDRVRLYAQVLLSIDLFAYLSDVVTPLFVYDVKPPEMPLWATVLRWSVTTGVLVTWLYTKLGRPGRTVLLVLESGITLTLSVVYTHIALAAMTGDSALYGPVFAMFGIALLLVIRSALVPSPVRRTVIIGIVAVASLFAITRATRGSMDPAAADGIGFIGSAFVITTAVTSHVIYGLRRTMRRALRLGQYELGRKIGEGGMGVVYEATHVMLRRPTAVKLLPIESVGEQTVLRFEREVRQTSRLEHPNSVAIFDYGRTPDGQFYYAMELLDGLTLQELVKDHGPVNAARAAGILGQAARALAEAHGLGLVHRDLKPANIMLCNRGGVPEMVKVLDFGLVKELDNPEVDDITQANAVVGTPHYLAPEAITKPNEVGPASDVYALGAVGYFLLTGREVFSGSSVIEICSKHLTQAPEPPSKLAGHALDARLEALLLRCLEKEPGDRPGDGRVLADALADLEIPGWSQADASDWWRMRPRTERASLDPAVEKTELAVDVARRT